MADIGHLESGRHYDADLDAVGAIEAELALVGFFKPRRHRRDVAEQGHLAAGRQTEVADILDAVDGALDRNADRAGAGIDGARWIDIVLAADGILQV